MASTGPRYAALRASPGTVSPGGATAGTYYCRYCQLSCTGPAPYKQHLDSAKHMKKASLYGGLQRQGAEDTGNCVASPDPHRARPSSRVDDVLAWTPSPVPSQTAVPSGGATGDPYYCQHCRLGCSGPEPFKQHLESARHIKKATLAGSPARQRGEDNRQQALPDPYRNCSSPSTDDLLHPVVTSDSAGTFFSSSGAPGGLYYCQYCQLSCTGPEPFKQHLESARHIKKAAQTGSPARQQDEDSRDSRTLWDLCRSRWSPSTDDPLHPVVTSDSAGTFSSSRGATGDPYHCQHCRLGCSGPEPFKQHLESARHIKKAAQTGSPVRQQDEDSRYDPASSDAHRARWSPSTDDPLHSVLTSDSAGTFSSSSGAPGGVYYCQYCQLSCTGPEPFKQHLESARHIKKAAQAGSPARIVRVPLGASSPRPEPGQPGQEPADPVWTELPQLQPDMMATCRTALLGSTAACRAVRRGSWLYDVVDRQDGVSEQVAIMVSQELKHLQPEGLTAFLQDTPLIRAEEPFSKRRC